MFYLHYVFFVVLKHIFCFFVCFFLFFFVAITDDVLRVFWLFNSLNNIYTLKWSDKMNIKWANDSRPINDRLNVFITTKIRNSWIKIDNNSSEKIFFQKTCFILLF